MSAKILIVDDDPVQGRLLATLVNRFGYDAELAEGGEAALERLRATRESAIDLMILDLVMPDLDGMGALSRMRAEGLDVPTIIATSPGSIEAAPAALCAGAIDFVVKPVGPERLQVAIKNALHLKTLENELRRLDRCAARALSLADLAATSAPMERVLRLAERAAKASFPVIIEGEPGVGKETIARAIQGASDRRGRAFVAINCARLNGARQEDLEAIIFGGEKSAGGIFEANGGVLFLGEVGGLPLSAQARLLRALEEGEAGPFGARRPVSLDVRLIAATSENLIERVKAGRFREDLYYRLNVFPIGAPPLRARREDIGALARGFCARFAAAEGKRLRGLSAEALTLLSVYDWPGNIRQLENALFRAVVLADGEELTVAEFPQIAARVEGFDLRIPAAPAPRAEGAPRETKLIRIEVRDPHVVSLLDGKGDLRRLDDIESDALKFALTHYRGRISVMARKLGIGRSTLYRKMKDHGFAPGAIDEAQEPNEANAESLDGGRDGAAA